MKNVNGGYPNNSGVSMLTRSYHSEISEVNRGRGLHRQHHDLVNGNYSTTINVAHNKNGNVGMGGAIGGRGEMNANGAWRGSQGCVRLMVELCSYLSWISSRNDVNPQNWES